MKGTFLSILLRSNFSSHVHLFLYLCFYIKFSHLGHADCAVLWHEKFTCISIWMCGLLKRFKWRDFHEGTPYRSVVRIKERTGHWGARNDRTLQGSRGKRKTVFLWSSVGTELVNLSEDTLEKGMEENTSGRVRSTWKIISTPVIENCF